MTFKQLPGIRNSGDGFQFETHGLNCFVVPKYLATTCFRAAGRELFYSYLYLYVHYALFEPPDDIHATVPATEPLTAIRRVLASKLGLDLLIIESQRELGEQLRDLLERGTPVLVPINRAACFYDVEMYGQTPVPTLLLIKGYNAATKVFLVQDWIQNSSLLASPSLEPLPTLPGERARYTFDPALRAALPLAAMVGSAYSEFAVLPALLEGWHQSYNQHFDYLQHQLQLMQPQQQPARINTGAEALADIATELELVLERVPTLIAQKLAILERRGSFGTESQMKAKLQFLNSQQVLAYTLAKLLPFDETGRAQARDLTAAGLTSWARWRDLIMSVAVMELQGTRQGAVLDRLHDLIIEAETTFLYKIYTLGTHLSP